jgi:hypothetical protein
MADLSQVKAHMDVVGADGVHVGTVDEVAGGRIKLTRADSGSHKHHHHYVSGGLVAAVEGNEVRLSANGDNAALMEEEYGGEALADRKRAMLRRAGIGAAVVAAIAGIGAAARRWTRRGGKDS